MKNFEQFSSLFECATETAWQEMVFKLGKNFGFEYVLIAIVPDRQLPLDKAFLRSNYSRQWRKYYDDHKLFQIDPTVAHCVTRSIPLVWEPDIFLSKQQKEMYEEACAYGLRSGVTLPFHGAKGELGMICFVNDLKPRKFSGKELVEKISEMLLLRDFAFESSLPYVKPCGQGIPPAITNRELECLKWSTEGKSSWEIAQILNCSEATVNFHFGNLRRKFNVSSLRQVIIKAIHGNLIYPA